MNSFESSLVKQGIADLQQGDLETAFNCFVQALRQDSGSVFVSVVPISTMDLKYQRITIVISLNELRHEFNPQSAVYIQDSLTTQTNLSM